MNGRGKPFEMSTINCLVPMSIFLKFIPDLWSLRIRLNSGSSGVWDAISSQLMPKSPTAAMILLRSLAAASDLAAEAARCAAEAEGSAGFISGLGAA